MDTEVTSASWLLWIVLQWTRGACIFWNWEFSLDIRAGMSDPVNTFLLRPVCLSRPHGIQVSPLRCAPHQIQQPVSVATRVQTVGCSKAWGWRLPWCSGRQPPPHWGHCTGSDSAEGEQQAARAQQGCSGWAALRAAAPSWGCEHGFRIPGREGRVPFLPMPVSRAGLRLLCGHSLLRLLLLRMRRCFSRIADAFKT